MRAVAMYPADKKITLVDRPNPRLEGEDQVRARMLEVGVCGTDHEIARFEYGEPPPGEPYLVMGHESLAEVVEVGPKVTGLKKGDLVVTTVRRSCGLKECRPCAHDRPDFCRTAAYTERGIMRRHGFMTDEIVDLGKNMHVVPRAIADIAVLTEPLTIAEKGLIELDSVLKRMPWLDPKKDDRSGLNAVVLGAGPVGLLGALALKVRGYETFVYSRESAKSPRAGWVERIGAHYIESGTLPVGDLNSKIGNVDLVYEATGAARLAFAALSSLGANGVFIFTGVPGHEANLTMDAQPLMKSAVLKNQLIYGTVNAGPPAFDSAIRDLARFKERWPEPVKELITGHFPPEKITDLLKEGGGIKNVLQFGTPSAGK